MAGRQLLLTLLLTIPRAHAETVCEPIWEEDFTGPLERAVWNVVEGDGCAEGIGGWGNNEAQSDDEAGASDKVPAAIHVTPKAAEGGAIRRIQNGDIISLNAATGELSVALEDNVVANRPRVEPPVEKRTVGRGPFEFSREVVSNAESGGCALFGPPIIDALSEAERSHAAAGMHCAS
jgi:hypothetical protein